MSCRFTLHSALEADAQDVNSAGPTLALLDFKWSLKYPLSSRPGRDPGISCESWSDLLAMAAASHGTSIQVNTRAFMLSNAV